MVRPNRLFTILVLVALVFSACQPIQAPAPSAEPAQAKSYTPRYEPADCFYEIPEGDQIECGYLTVPEDRSQPDGRMIRLYVVNFKSKSETPAPDPLIVLIGGPGSPGAFYNYLWTATPIAETLRAERDNIMLEHRGANYSEPAFYCAEMETNPADLVGMSFAEEVAWSGQAFAACAERWQQEGWNLSAYSSMEAAADVLDLRTAMGYEVINVIGMSYGTLPAMQLMRFDPTGIRSIIIDSIEPPEINWLAEMLKSTHNFLNTVFSACAEDAACHAAYPDLEKAFYETLARLRANPVPIPVSDEAGNTYDVMVDDLLFVQFVTDSGIMGMDYLQTPAVIYAAYQGDLQPTAQAWLDRVAYRHAPTGPGTWSWSMGLYYTVECLQDGTSITMDVAQKQYAQLGGDPSVHDWAATAFLTDTLAVCPAWQLTPPDPNVAIEPVTSDLPTLMLVNKFDTGLPAYLSRPSAEQLPNSFFLELPAGHGSVLTPCGQNLMMQFLADPTQAPDASCIDEMTKDWVLPEK